MTDVNLNIDHLLQMLESQNIEDAKLAVDIIQNHHLINESNFKRFFNLRLNIWWSLEGMPFPSSNHEVHRDFPERIRLQLSEDYYIWRD